MMTGKISVGNCRNDEPKHAECEEAENGAVESLHQWISLIDNIANEARYRAVDPYADYPPTDTPADHSEGPSEGEFS
jgi:hypothetical protein